MHSHPWRRAALATLIATSALGIAGAQAAGGPALPVTGAVAVATTTCKVTAYGADASGVKDSTVAIRNAITACAASAGPNTVYFPAGTYALKDTGSANPTLKLAGPNPVILQGAGRDATKLVEYAGVGNPATCPGGGTTPGPTCPVRSLLGVAVDGSTVEDMTLDTATYNAGTALGTVANNGSYLRLRVTHGSLAGGFFSLYFAGPAGATRTTPTFNTGNTINDLILTDAICDDSLSYSFQAAGSISNVQHTGSRLALYFVHDVTVTNYRYTPGPQGCGAKKQGFYITSPSSNVTINGFTSSGAGGVIGQSTPPSANIVLNDYRLTGSGGTLEVGDVVGLTIQQQSGTCDMGDNILRINPSAPGTLVAVRNCSLAMVHLASTANALLAGLTFAGDTFTVPNPRAVTFSDIKNVPVAVVFAGGTYLNCPSKTWFSNSTAPVFAGANTLTGYPC